jgi:hypothetical protein
MAWRSLPTPLHGSVFFRLRMTQSHLADATGLTPVHVNRSLKALGRAGLVFRAGTVYIEDWERFAEVGDFDPSYLQTDLRPGARLGIAS